MIQAIFSYFIGFLVMIAALRIISFARQVTAGQQGGKGFLARIAPLMTCISMPVHRIVAIVLWNG